MLMNALCSEWAQCKSKEKLLCVGSEFQVSVGFVNITECDHKCMQLCPLKHNFMMETFTKNLGFPNIITT